MEPARRGGRRALLPLLGALLLLALAAGASAWPQPHHGAAAGFSAGGERRYQDLAQRRMESVRSSFGATRRDLATVSTHALKAATPP
jgi:hypothetical protein